MAIFIARVKFTAEAFKGLINDPTDREKIAKEFAESIGSTMLAWYFDFSAGEAVSLWDATPEQMDIAKMRAIASGAFVDIYQSQLYTSSELLELSKKTAAIEPWKGAPTHDEIDRMLLDE